MNFLKQSILIVKGYYYASKVSGVKINTSTSDYELTLMMVRAVDGIVDSGNDAALIDLPPAGQCKDSDTIRTNMIRCARNIDNNSPYVCYSYNDQILRFDITEETNVE